MHDGSCILLPAALRLSSQSKPLQKHSLGRAALRTCRHQQNDNHKAEKEKDDNKIMRLLQKLPIRAVS